MEVRVLIEAIRIQGLMWDQSQTPPGAGGNYVIFPTFVNKFFLKLL